MQYSYYYNDLSVFIIMFQTNNRIGIMASSVKSYIINHLRNETAVGIVSFESSSYELASMTEITDSNVRTELASKVPNSTGGGTGIGSGLELCQNVSTFRNDHSSL